MREIFPRQPPQRLNLVFSSKKNAQKE